MGFNPKLMTLASLLWAHMHILHKLRAQLGFEKAAKTAFNNLAKSQILKMQILWLETLTVLSGVANFASEYECSKFF